HVNPKVRLRFEFGALHEMAGRLSGQGPGDVLVTADTASMEEAADHLAGRPRIIARSALTIAVAPGNPHRVRGLADLTRPRLRVVVGAESVPEGRYTRQVFAKAGLTVRSSAKVISARAVLSRLRAGQADAGVVLVTDRRPGGIAAAGVPIPTRADGSRTIPDAGACARDPEGAVKAFLSRPGSAAAERGFRAHGLT